MLVNQDGIVQTCNARAGRILGVTEEDTLGTPRTEIIGKTG